MNDAITASHLETHLGKDGVDEGLCVGEPQLRGRQGSRRQEAIRHNHRMDACACACACATVCGGCTIKLAVKVTSHPCMSAFL